MDRRRSSGPVVPFGQSLDFASFKTGTASAARNQFTGGVVDTAFSSGVFFGVPPCLLDGSTQAIIQSSTVRNRAFKNGAAIGGSIANAFAVFGGNGTNGDTIVSSTTFKVGDDNVAWFWNLDTSTVTGAKRWNIWKNNVLDSGVVHSVSGADVSHLIDWTEGATPGWFIGCGAAHASPFTGMMGVLWHTNTYVDWGDPTINAAVWDSTLGALKDPGADGSGWTGTAPIVYLRLKKSDPSPLSFLTNHGTGGDFTQQATPLSAPYISSNGINISGQIERFSRMQLAWGDSFTDGTASTVQDRCVRRLVAQASGRDDFNGGKGGYSVRFISGDSTNFIQGYSSAWYGGASINGTIGTTSLNGPIERRPGGTATYSDILCRMQGTYNDIHAGNWPSPGFSGTMAACAAMKADWLANGNGQPYYFVGPTNGGQSANPSATYLADNEEYGPVLGGLSGGPYYQYLQLLWDLSTGLKSIFGSLYLDLHDALVTDANDATIQSDGWPLGSLQIALAAGLIGSVTANDLTDLANNVVPRSLRSTASVSGVTTAPGLTGINYGIHLLDAGHFAHFIKEMRFKAALGIN